MHPGGMTIGDALAGRKLWLAAIGVGGFGVGEMFSRRVPIALGCLMLTLVLFRLARMAS